jgi:hypothetical protein
MIPDEQLIHSTYDDVVAQQWEVPSKIVWLP